MAVIKNSYTRPLMLTNDLIGGKWKIRILWHIIQGHNRYSMILKEIPEISEKVLGAQLKELTESGLLEKRVIDDNPPKVIEYHLGMNKEQLKDLVESICKFTESYAQEKGIISPRNI